MLLIFKNRCIHKRSEAQDVTTEELKWLRIDYEIRCVQLVALCLQGAQKANGSTDNTPFLVCLFGILLIYYHYYNC